MDPRARPLEDLCQISERLGCLKIERDGIKKFFSTAAKTYSVQTVSGEVTIKAKGFNLLEKLLKDNNRACLLESNVKNMFVGIDKYAGEKNPTSKIFQKQIKVNPTQMVPALVPKQNCYKLFNFIGPRRQIDLDNWATFKFERILSNFNEQLTIDPKVSEQNKASQGDSVTYSCGDFLSSTFVQKKSGSVTENEKKYSVCLVPELRGILPALPYGFDVSNVSKILPFYKLL